MNNVYSTFTWRSLSTVVYLKYIYKSIHQCLCIKNEIEQFQLYCVFLRAMSVHYVMGGSGMFAEHTLLEFVKDSYSPHLNQISKQEELSQSFLALSSFY